MLITWHFSMNLQLKNEAIVSCLDDRDKPKVCTGVNYNLVEIRASHEGKTRKIATREVSVTLGKYLLYPSHIAAAYMPLCPLTELNILIKSPSRTDFIVSLSYLGFLKYREIGHGFKLNQGKTSQKSRENSKQSERELA